MPYYWLNTLHGVHKVILFWEDEPKKHKKHNQETYFPTTIDKGFFLFDMFKFTKKGNYPIDCLLMLRLI